MSGKKKIPGHLGSYFSYIELAGIHADFQEARCPGFGWRPLCPGIQEKLTVKNLGGLGGGGLVASMTAGSRQAGS